MAVFRSGDASDRIAETKLTLRALKGDDLPAIICGPKPVLNPNSEYVRHRSMTMGQFHCVVEATENEKCFFCICGCTIVSNAFR